MHCYVEIMYNTSNIFLVVLESRKKILAMEKDIKRSLQTKNIVSAKIIDMVTIHYLISAIEWSFISRMSINALLSLMN